MLLDTPPGRGNLSGMAVLAADGLLIPALAADLDVRGAGKLYDLVEGEIPGLRILGVLIAASERRWRITRDASARMQADEMRVLPVHVPTGGAGRLGASLPGADRRARAGLDGEPRLPAASWPPADGARTMTARGDAAGASPTDPGNDRCRVGSPAAPVAERGRVGGLRASLLSSGASRAPGGFAAACAPLGAFFLAAEWRCSGGRRGRRERVSSAASGG